MFLKIVIDLENVLSVRKFPQTGNLHPKANDKNHTTCGCYGSQIKTI